MPRILLIEDDFDVRTVFEHILIDADFQVDTTQTITAGKELLRFRTYDLVIADGRLPDGTGTELADEAAERDIPVLIVTGYAFIMRELTKCPGRYNVLLKPMRPTELVVAVKATLEQRQPDDA
jgi:DNA-binding NtrC family response regulator